MRGLAKRIGISSPFLSDIELGRRFPSEEILAKLAGALEVSPDELKQYDTAPPMADLKRVIDLDPKLGFAFRTVVEKVKNGELTAEDIEQEKVSIIVGGGKDPEQKFGALVLKRLMMRM